MKKMRSNATLITKESISLLRKQRKTYQEIGDAFGVSKQRIHQIYKGYCSVHKKVWNKKKHKKEPKFFKHHIIIKKCLECQKEFKIFRQLISNRKFCSIQCYWNYYGYPKSEEEKRNNINKYHKKYYQEVVKKDSIKLAKYKKNNKKSYNSLRKGGINVY